MNRYFTNEAEVHDNVAPDRPGLDLPSLGMGCAAIANLYRAMRDADAQAALAAAAAGGIRYFDTAPYYGHGLSESRLGAFLRHCAGDVILSSKVGRSLVPGAPQHDTGFVDAAPFTPVFDYSREGVLDQVDGSLQRLGRDAIDILFVHDIGAMTHGADHRVRFEEALGGAFPALAELKSRGTVGAIGIGVNEIAVCLETMAEVEIDIILLAGRYTLLEQAALDELLPLCVERGVRVVIGGPYNSGILAGGAHYNYGAAPAEVLERVQAIGDVCALFKVPLASAALQFPLAHAAVASVIPGARTASEVEANIGFMAHAIPPDFWAELKARKLLRSDAPVPGEAG